MEWERTACAGEGKSVKRPEPEVVPNVGLRLNSTGGKQKDGRGSGEKTHREMDVIKVGRWYQNTLFLFVSLSLCSFALSCLFSFMCNKYMYLQPVLFFFLLPPRMRSAVAVWQIYWSRGEWSEKTRGKGPKNGKRKIKKRREEGKRVRIDERSWWVW